MLWLTMWKKNDSYSLELKIQIWVSEILSFGTWGSLSACNSFWHIIGTRSMYVKCINDQDNTDEEKASFLVDSYIP